MNFVQDLLYRKWCTAAIHLLPVKKILWLQLWVAEAFTKSTLVFKAEMHGTLSLRLYSYLSPFPVHLALLFSDSPHLLEVHDKFEKLVKKFSIPCLSFGESVKTVLGFRMSKVLVPMESAGIFLYISTNCYDSRYSKSCSYKCMGWVFFHWHFSEIVGKQKKNNFCLFHPNDLISKFCQKLKSS